MLPVSTRVRIAFEFIALNGDSTIWTLNANNRPAIAMTLMDGWSLILVLKMRRHSSIIRLGSRISINMLIDWPPLWEHPVRNCIVMVTRDICSNAARRYIFRIHWIASMDGIEWMNGVIQLKFRKHSKNSNLLSICCSPLSEQTQNVIKATVMVKMQCLCLWKTWLWWPWPCGDLKLHCHGWLSSNSERSSSRVILKTSRK